MKKNTILLGALFVSGIAFSQVGINTDSPKATLDVVSSPSDITKTDGFIAPRLKGSELKVKDALYSANQTGAIVYVTEALTSSATSPKTINVTMVGYFYFDGAVWQKIGNGATNTTEPWNIQTTTNPATGNTQDIYQTGSVAVGKNAAQSGVILDVNGAVRGGTAHTGTVGSNSVAFGEGNTASGMTSAAMGSNSTASGDNAVAVGSQNEASGYGSVAMGFNSVASEQGAIAMGQVAVANNMGAVSIGDHTTASGWSATAMGANTTASGDYSTAMGSQTKALSQFETAIGVKNAAVPNALFTVGNGSNAGSNAVTVTSNSNIAKMGVGTSTTAPTEILDVNGTARVRNLPANGAANAIYTQSNGAASATQNQTFTATKTVVADANGVLGYITTLPAAPTEPWYNQATSTQATGNTQNIYQAGKVSIGKNASGGILSVYDPSAAVNTTPLYIGYVSQADNTKNSYLAAIGNLGTGSYSTLSISGDQALVFSVDGDPTTYTRNALELIPHTAGGGASPFGFKITEQGMFSFNAQYPTETLDLALGTARIRNLPLNGAANAIYTTPAGAASVPASTDINGLGKTQTFTASRTVVADANGVLGYVAGLPSAMPLIIAGADGADAVTTPKTIQQKNSVGNATVSTLLTTKTFTLAKKSLVSISYNVTVTDIYAFDGSILRDGSAKKLGAFLNLDGIGISANGATYTNSTNAMFLDGIFYLQNTKAIVMNAGSHTIELYGEVFAGATDSVGVKATFGAGALDQLDITAMALQ